MANYKLMDEPPMLIFPSLATRIGLNESIVLQQLNFLLQNSSKVINNKKWVYNSYSQWQQIFPFLSERTIQRTFLSLEEQKLIITANHNKLKMDKTKWYTIDYDVFDSL